MIFCMQLVMYMPELGGGKKNKSRVGYSEAKRELYHQVLRRVLGSLQKAHNQGGFYVTRVRCMLLCISKHTRPLISIWLARRRRT